MLQNSVKNPFKQWKLIKSCTKLINPLFCVNKFGQSFPGNKPVTLNLTFSRLCSINHRFFHSTGVNQVKLFKDIENDFARQVLPKLPISLSLGTVTNPVKTLNEFESLLNRNWRKSTASEVVEAFSRVRDYSIDNNIDLSDHRFDKLVDGLMDTCEHLKDEEILQLLLHLDSTPQCESMTSHNYHDVWSCLDDICCWKIVQWNVDQILTFVDLWYRLNLGRVGDFVFECIDRCLKRYKYLDRNQLIWLFFAYNVARRHPVDFELEHKLIDFLDNFTLDQLGVIAMGYFKSKSKIKLTQISRVMALKVAANAANVNEITLTAILKVLRFSQCWQLEKEFTLMLDALRPEIDRLSTFCCLHIALIGTGVQYYHPATLASSTQRIIDDIAKIRLKDIERVILANAMFDFDPKTSPDLYKTCMDELKNDRRRLEIAKYNRCLPCALNFLSIREIYDYHLMSEVIANDFIIEVYGRNPHLIPREIFTLDCSIDIECPGYVGNRLLPHQRYKSAKWLIEYAPSYQQHKKLSRNDEFFLDVVDNLRIVVGGDDFLQIDHILPQFSRADVVTCVDLKNGGFLRPIGSKNYILGDVKHVPIDDPDRKWFAFVILNPNITNRVDMKPLGFIAMKIRQLEKIGYQPICIHWDTFPRLSKEAKLIFLKEQMV